MCHECGKPFKRKDKMKEHVKRMHSEERKLKQRQLQASVRLAPAAGGHEATPSNNGGVLASANQSQASGSGVQQLDQHLAKVTQSILLAIASRFGISQATSIFEDTSMCYI